MSKVLEFKRNKDIQPVENRELESVPVLEGVDAFKDAIKKLSKVKAKNVFVIKELLELALKSTPNEWFNDIDFFFGTIDNDNNSWEANFISYVEARYNFGTDCITVVPFLYLSTLEEIKYPEDFDIPEADIVKVDQYFGNLSNVYDTSKWGYFNFVYNTARYLVYTFECKLFKLTTWEFAVSFENNGQTVVATFDFTSMFRDLLAYDS